MSQFQCRWALLGLSNIANTFVDDILIPRDASESIAHIVVCVSTTGTEKRAKNWLKQHKSLNGHDVKIFTSADKMLRSGDFDIVYISTPHPLHYAHSRSAIQNGRNVLVEKPATMNKPQYENLIALAKEANVVLMEAMWTRYLPAVLYLEQELLPKIGNVKRVFSDLSVPIVDKDTPLTHRLVDKQAGAGSMLDMGVYALAWADIAFGRSSAVKVVFSSTVKYNTGKELIDDINTTVLSNPENDGAVAVVTTSLTLAGSSKIEDKLAVKKVAPSVRIEAANAQVCVPFPLIRPQELHVEWYNKDNLGLNGGEKHEIIKKPVERGWGFWYEADIIAKEVKNRENNKGVAGVVIGEADSLRILEWMDTARKMSGISYDAALEAL